MQISVADTVLWSCLISLIQITRVQVQVNERKGVEEGPYISTYWADVVTEIRSIISLELDFNFNIFYLGIVSTALKKWNTFITNTNSRQ